MCVVSVCIHTHTYMHVHVHACLYYVVSSTYCISTNLVVLKTLDYACIVCVCVCVCMCVVFVRGLSQLMVVVSLKLINQLLVKNGEVQ